jgi:hypothetical protein
MFRITMLPAAQGDCLWVEYGSATTPKRLLIDGGVHRTGDVLRNRIEALDPSERVFELAVVTHVDLDHIAGMLRLLEDPPDGLVIRDFWFNGWDHLPKDATDTTTLGPGMGEELMEWLRRQTSTIKAWNGKFDGKAVSVGSMELPDDPAGLPRHDFDGMHLTVLGPTGTRLARFRPKWEKEIERLGLEPGRAGAELIGHPEDAVEDDSVLGEVRLRSTTDLENLARGPFHEDASHANGSSIVLLAEHAGKRCLFTGDAFAADVLAAVQLLTRDDGGTPLAVHAWKIAHHGGEKNTSPDLIGSIDTGTYLVSTSGSRYQHPKAETLARVVTGRPEGPAARLVFNYRSDFTERWDDPSRFAPKYEYEPLYPATDGTQTIDL